MKNIVFIHGNSSSKNAFKNQVSTLLSNEYYVKSYDLPGHGGNLNQPESFSFSTQDNASSLLKSIKTDFESQLNQNSPLYLIGHSYGTHVCIELIKQGLRVDSLIAINASPMEVAQDLTTAFNPIASAQSLFKENLTEKELNELLDDMNLKESKKTVRDDFLKTNPLFRSKLFTSIGLNPKLEEISTLNKSSTRTILMLSKNEKILNANYFNNLKTRLTNAEFFHFEKESHYPQLDHPFEFNDFLKKVLN